MKHVHASPVASNSANSVALKWQRITHQTVLSLYQPHGFIKLVLVMLTSTYIVWFLSLSTLQSQIQEAESQAQAAQQAYLNLIHQLNEASKPQHIRKSPQSPWEQWVSDLSFSSRQTFDRVDMVSWAEELQLSSTVTDQGQERLEALSVLQTDFAVQIEGSYGQQRKLTELALQNLSHCALQSIRMARAGPEQHQWQGDMQWRCWYWDPKPGERS